MVRSTPLRISVSSIEAWRFSISNMGTFCESAMVTCLALRQSQRSPGASAPASVFRCRSRPGVCVSGGGAGACRFRGARSPLAFGAGAHEYRVVVLDLVSCAISGDVLRQERDRDIDILDGAAHRAVHVVVPVGALVEAARLIREGELLDQ